MNGPDLLTAITSVVAGVVAAVVAVRKAAPGMMASLVRRQAEQSAVERHPVVIVGADEVERLTVYEQLIARVFEFRSITLSLETGQQGGVIALCHGQLAACQASDGKWRLSHIGSGFLITTFDWWDDACVAAVRLDELDWTHAAETGHPAREILKQRVVQVLADVRRESALAMIDLNEVPT